MARSSLKATSRMIRALLIGLLLAATSIAPAAAHESSTLSSKVALDWNINAVNAVRAARTMDGIPAGGAPRPFYQPEGVLYTAYVQAAVYDAVMKITHRYELYHHFSAAAGDASPEAAVVSAAYNTLVFYLGDAGGVLTAEYNASIAGLPAGRKTARGIAVGAAAAADIEQLRANDGRNAPVSDACPTATVPPTPGAWLCAPSPSIQLEVTPWLANVKPFLLKSPSQFRTPAPPALSSALFATDLAEVKTFGDVNAPITVRTPAMTAVAYFWIGNAINQYNDTLRGVAVQHNMDLVDTVRTLAMGIMGAADAGIGCYDSKYHYLFWRPVTAIRADGIAADATWTPLLATPQHPEYPSAHGCLTSSVARSLVHILGTTNLNVTVPGGQGGSANLTTTQTFATEQALDADVVNARIWVGYHYRNSVHAGENLGQAVADWSAQHFFQPSDEEGGDD